MKETKYPLSIKEEELKRCVADDWFGSYYTNKILGNIDFSVAVTEPKPNTPMVWLLWAEAKKGISHNIDDSFVQLILTIGRAKTFDRELQPGYLGAFDAGRIAFIPYDDIQEVFTYNDFNWNVAPNNHKTKEFILLKERVSGILAKEKLTFDYITDAEDLKAFVRERVAKHAKPGQITKNNFTHIYNRWLKVVKPTISFVEWDEMKEKGIIDADFFLADILSLKNSTISKKLTILLQNDHYRRAKGVDLDGDLVFTEIGFRDGQKAHNAFWKQYVRPPKEEYWDYIVNRRDLLVPQDIREVKGAYFTPRQWVELSQEYLARALGENWQDEYYIWDCCAGTGNLLAGLVNRKNIWASTLEQQDVDVMLQRIANMNDGLAGDEEGANLFPSHVFQFDFLNDPFTKLPQDLQNIINDPEKRKKLVIYINPPYAEATASKSINSTQSKHKAGVSQSEIAVKYKDKLGRGVNELFAQFLIRIFFEINGAIVGNFSKIKVLSSQNFVLFRSCYTAKLRSLFLVPGDTFDNVSGQFPIGFFVWDTSINKPFNSIVADVYGRKGESLAQKRIETVNKNRVILNWMQKYYSPEEERIAYMVRGASDFQNNQIVFITLKPSQTVINHSQTHNISMRHLIPNCIFLAVRHCIEHTWLNDRDQFLYPNDSWKDDFEFQRDCLAYTLFHGQNRIRSADGVNHWVPFSEDEMGAKDEIKSHFMIDILSGKTPLTEPEEEQASLDFMNPDSAGSALSTESQEFSPEAQAVLDSALPLYRYYHSRPDANPNASFYDIRQYFQGVDEKGRMNPTSADEKYNQLLAELRQAQKCLAAKIADGVYRHGFLK